MVAVIAVVNYLVAALVFALLVVIWYFILRVEGMIGKDRAIRVNSMKKYFANWAKRRSKIAKLAHLLSLDPMRFGWRYTIVLTIITFAGPLIAVLGKGATGCISANLVSFITGALWLTALLMRDKKLSERDPSADIPLKGSPDIPCISTELVTDDNALDIIQTMPHTAKSLPVSFATLRIVLMLVVCLAPFALFFSTSAALSSSTREMNDARLLAADSAMFGWLFPKGQMGLWLDQHPTLGPNTKAGKVIGDILTIVYVSYYGWPFFTLVYIFLKATVQERMAGPRHEQATWCICETLQCAWVIVFMTTFILNCVVPAKSPRIYLKDEYVNSIEQTGLRKFLKPLIHQDDSSGSFPSGHVGETLCIGLSAALLHVWPWVSVVNIVASVFMALSTLWLRYHYIIDVLAAIVVSICAAWLSGAMTRFNMDSLGLIPALPPQEAPLSLPEELLTRIRRKPTVLFDRKVKVEEQA